MNRNISRIAEDFIKDCRKILTDNLIEQYIFGSQVKKTNVESSDIDILLIVFRIDTKIKQQISALASDYSINHNIVISPILKEKSVWEKNKKYNTLFYIEVKQFGIAL
jgi:predicted nucleotidyltransferase